MLPQCTRIPIEAFRQVVAGSAHEVLFNYWNERCHGLGQLPRLRDIEPHRLKPVLARLTILDHRPERQDYWVRMAGTAVRDAMQIEITGKYVCDIFEQPTLNEFLARYDLVRITGCPYYCQLARLPDDRKTYRYRCIMLPLGNDQLIGTCMLDSHLDFRDCKFSQMAHELYFVEDYLVDLE